MRKEVFMSSILAYGEVTITNLSEPYSIILTNEAHQFSTNTSNKPLANSSCFTDIIVFQGSKEISDFTIGSIPSANGITVTKSSNRVTFTVTTNTTIGSVNGTFTIPIIIDGETYNKIFSWSCSRQGAQGAQGTSAKSLDIVATSQIFRSNDGGITFYPDTVTLTPILQGGITYSKWQYSINGGSSWVNISSGSHGFTISSGKLTIAKDCDLFTDNLATISFKCISNDANYYDVISVFKIYDVSDIRFANRNLILNSAIPVENSKYQITTYNTSVDLKPATKYTFVLKGTISSPNRFAVFFNNGSNLGAYFPTGQNGVVEYATMESPATINESYKRKLYVYNYPSSSAQMAEIEWVALYEGEIIPPLDWTPAPEDITNQITTITDTVTGLESTVNKVDQQITNKIWRTDTVTVTDFDGTQKSKTIQEILTDSTQDLYSFTQTVSSKYVTIEDNQETLAEAKSYAEQQVNGFKTTVENTYATKTNLTAVEQTADKISWLISNNSTSSSLTLTNSALTAISNQVVFKSPNGNQVVIEDGKINANAITSDMLATNAIKSQNYVAGSGDIPYTTSGTFLDLSNGYFYTKDFVSNADGAFFRGTINAESGNIASFHILESSLYTGNKNSFTSTSDGVYIANNGISLGSGFSVDQFGYLITNKGTIAGWDIDETGFYYESVMDGMCMENGIYDDGTTNVYMSIKRGTYSIKETDSGERPLGATVLWSYLQAVDASGNEVANERHGFFIRSTGDFAFGLYQKSSSNLKFYVTNDEGESGEFQANCASIILNGNVKFPRFILGTGYADKAISINSAGMLVSADSNWQTATLSTAFNPYNNNDDNIPKYRKINNIVEIKGKISPKNTIAGSANTTRIFTLPSAYRPTYNREYVCHGSGKHTWLLQVNNDGVVSFSRYGGGGGENYVTCQTDAWLTFSACFII